MANSNVLIHGRAPGNQKLSIRCDEDGLLFTDTQIRDQNGNYIVINGDGSITSRMQAKNYTESTLENPVYQLLNVDNSGNLSTNIKASGINLTSTNGALDVNVKNVTVDISGGISVNNFPSIYDVSGNVDVSGTVISLVNNAQSSILIYGNDYTGTNTHNPLYVDANGFISTTILEAKHSNVIYDLEISKSSITYDSGNSWTANPFSEQNGWYFTNNVSSNIGYLYWYNNGDYSNLVSYPTESNIQYNELDIVYSIVSLYDVNYKPKLIIYSKPTGTSDYLPNVAHSIWEFSINSGSILNTGENILIYYGNTARIKTMDAEVRRVELTLSATYGQALSTEVIGHIFLRTYSTPSANNNKLNVIECGLYHKQVGLLEYYFDNSKKRIEKENLNKLTFDNSNKLKVDVSGQQINVTNKVDVSGVFWPTTQPISGSVSVSNFPTTQTVITGTESLDVNITGGTITGANGKAYLYSGNEATSITATTISSKNGIDANIINTVDTSSLISANYGSTKTPLICDNTGQLYTTGTISGGFVNIKSTSGNTIGSDVTNQSLNVNIAGINNDGSALVNKISYTGISANKRALDCEVSNSYLTTRLSDTNGIGIGSYGTALNVNVVNNATPITVYDAKTVSIDSKIPSGLTTTTNTTTGLNVYPILPLGKTYTMSGVGNTGSYIVFAGSALSTITITSQSWGLANPKSWYAKCSVARTLNYEYIDDTGATGTGTISLSAGVYSGILPLQGGGSGTNKIVGINKWWTTVNLAIGDTVLISATSASDTNAIAGGGPTYSNIGVFTCPEGYRAFISNVNVGLSQGSVASGDTVRLFHFSTTGIRTVRHVLSNVITAQSYNINSGNAYGSIGGWLEPGEAFMWGGQSGDANITQRNISCQIMCINY